MSRFILFFVAFCSFSSVQAMTMTFDNLHEASPVGANSYSEAGITVSSLGDLGYSSEPGALHLDDSGSSIASSVTFTTGAIFDAVSFDIMGSGESSLYYDLFNIVDFSELSASNIAYDNVLVEGYVGGNLVGEDRFYMNDESTYLFSSDFLGIDALVVRALLPDFSAIENSLMASFPDYIVNRLDCTDLPCAHFNIDNIELRSVSAVPLPASLPLFTCALLAYAYIGRLRKSRQVSM